MLLPSQDTRLSVRDVDTKHFQWCTRYAHLGIHVNTGQRLDFNTIICTYMYIYVYTLHQD